MQPTPQTLLIDTNIVSFILKRDTRASAYAPLLDGHRLAVSFATVAELYEWASIRKWGQRRQQELTETLATYLVIPVDIALCRQWGALRAEQQAQGTPMNTHDAWIAATARHYGLPLVTHNPKHFRTVRDLDVRSIQPV
jgi:tRNA(fMet)-specific endonuclease VapC